MIGQSMTKLEGSIKHVFSRSLYQVVCLLLTSSLFYWISLPTKCALIRVRDVKEAIWVLALLVHLAHQSVSLENVSAVHKEVERVLLRQSDPLSNDKAKLIGGQVARGQISKQT